MHEGKLKTVTVSLNPSGEYYASLLFEWEGDEPVPSTEGKAIGVDLGINHFAVTSDGSKFDNPRTLRKYERNLKRKQRKLSRKQKGSNRRKKARRLVAKVHQHIVNVRKDFLHKLSRRLVNENQVLAVESLNVKGMVKNHNLAKAISDCSWSTFVGMLKYKCEREGKVLMQVDRFFPSSKTCSECLYQVGEMPLDVRAWTCPKCGTHHDRDINAAQNIVAEAKKLLASGTGATASGGSVRPKPGRKSAVAAAPREAGRHASIS
jgi:putative transposase